MKIYTNRAKNKKAIIFRQKDRTTTNGYLYYITVLTRSSFGVFLVNDSYKQRLDITSAKTAKRIAIELIETEI